MHVMNVRLAQKRQKRQRRFTVKADDSDWVPEFPLAVMGHSMNIEGKYGDWELRGADGELFTLARGESGRQFLLWCAETLNRAKGFGHLYKS